MDKEKWELVFCECEHGVDIAMAKYEIELTETIYHDPISVEAESEEEAEQKARKSWENGEMTTGESDLQFKVEVSDNG